jgi:hypothetical protein
VLDREAMVEIVESLCVAASFQAGDRVVWQPDGSKSELMALPESLTREKSRKA